ncbi:MAG: suppressor of fused domain protein [Planctomycetota bacterium]
MAPPDSIQLQHELPSDVPPLKENDPAVTRAIARHVAQWFGPVEGTMEEAKSIYFPLMRHMCLPNDRLDCVTLVTSGISTLPMNVPAGTEAPRLVEFIQHLPKYWRPPTPAEHETSRLAWLAKNYPLSQMTMVSRMPAMFGTFFAPGHTISDSPKPDPFAPGVDFCAWYVRIPRSIPKEAMFIGKGKGTIALLEVVPLYQEELALINKKGSEEIERRWKRFDPTMMYDPKRPNFGKKKLGLF